MHPGTVVAGRYAIIEPLGSGAMGAVFLAKDRDLERKIALKLHKDRTVTPHLRREALAMARLAHPNVVTVFEVGEHDGQTFVAMEYVEGTALRAWLDAERRTSDEILDVLLAAGEGLVAAHAARLVHRDFKPDNVLIGSDGRTRVSDFGLARESGNEVAAAGGAADSTGVAGTPEYMSPEQALGRSVDGRADQYSFCAVVWGALVGAWPRDGGPTTHPRLRRVLERGLAADPAARYPTMAALLSAIRSTRSRRHLVLGGITIALLVVGTAVGFAWTQAASATGVSCGGAGMEIIPFGLDVPARVSVSAPPATVNVVDQKLASYRSKYIATARQVCRNGLVDRTWSLDLYRRGVACLDLRRRIMTSLFESVIRTGSVPDLIERVVSSSDESACGDASILASRPPSPDDPALLTELVTMRTAIELALADSSPVRRQRLRDALALVESSRVADLPSIIPRLGLVRASLLIDEGKLKDAETALTEVYYGTRAADDSNQGLSALTLLITLYAVRNDVSALSMWFPVANADAQHASTHSPATAARVYVSIADHRRVWRCAADARMGEQGVRAARHDPVS